MAEKLEIAGIAERDLTWANVRLANGRALAPDDVRSLRPKRIVALGKPATRWCVEHGLIHEAVPHPAYWQRFHETAPYPLVDLLMGG